MGKVGKLVGIAFGVAVALGVGVTIGWFSKPAGKSYLTCFHYLYISRRNNCHK